MAIFGFRYHGSGPSSEDERWFIDVKKLNAWQASQRLETIKLLLEYGAKIEGYMKEALKSLVKDVSKDESRYAKLLLEIAGDRDILGSFDARKSKVFPKSMVWESHAGWLFPEYKILV